MSVDVGKSKLWTQSSVSGKAVAADEKGVHCIGNQWVSATVGSFYLGIYYSGLGHILLWAPRVGS